ncbi:MAG: non-lysosomal glucosylceramidase [Eubacteriales bacterium]|nr:non-lysosomal glucosylceramidase [Eubacteriales bacterium]
MPFASFSGRDRYTVFPVGGIGTGTVGVDACGRLCEFEIFNRPQMGNKLPYSFFALHCEGDGFVDTRVLEAEVTPDFAHARGYHPQEVRGLPRLADSRMEVRYPFCEIEFIDDTLPLTIHLTTMNPLIPLNVTDSGIPAMLLRYRVRNVAQAPVSVLLCGSMPNFYGFRGFDCFDNYQTVPGASNRPVRQGGCYGLWMLGEGEPRGSLCEAQGALMTNDADAQLLPTWYKGGWQDGITAFWKALCRGELPRGEYGQEARQSRIGPEGLTVGTIGIQKQLAPQEEVDFVFVFSWYVPNRPYGWFAQEAQGRTMRNAYALRFTDAWQAGTYLLTHLHRLEAESRQFSTALYESTLPEAVIESAAYSLTALRSNTCFLTEDGAFYGWEGCHEQEGSCHGTCTHVWNYAQTVAYLFPQLERNARTNELLNETDACGKMSFRTQQSFGLPPFELPAAVDGQLGMLVRLWREYQLSSDRAFLARLYPAACRALDYARRTWDPDGDQLLEAKQHNTYDIEFIGVNPLSGVLYLAALKAMAAMAEALDKPADQSAFTETYRQSAAALDERCFNGEWYVQRTGLEPPPYQFGDGCLSDQLFGQTLAFLTGLGELLPHEHLRMATASIWRYNFSDGHTPRWCLQRTFVAPDEAGLRLCSWPHGGEPAFPFVYSDEVWTGVEYQAATTMVCLGMFKEAEALVSAVRARFDSNRRNPFNEMECGFHYARSMAAWGLIPAYGGMTLAGGTRFAPRIHQEDFQSIFSDGQRWGVVRQTMDAQGQLRQQITVLGTIKPEPTWVLPE